MKVDTDKHTLNKKSTPGENNLQGVKKKNVGHIHDISL